MTRRKSVQQLVSPLLKLSLLSSSSSSPYKPDLEHVPEQLPLFVIQEQTDMLSLFPREVILKIFSLLSFQDLIRVQLVSND
jgi:hypothetical protein